MFGGKYHLTPHTPTAKLWNKCCLLRYLLSHYHSSQWEQRLKPHPGGNNMLALFISASVDHTGSGRLHSMLFFILPFILITIMPLVYLFHISALQTVFKKKITQLSYRAIIVIIIPQLLETFETSSIVNCAEIRCLKAGFLFECVCLYVCMYVCICDCQKKRKSPSEISFGWLTFGWYWPADALVWAYMLSDTCWSLHFKMQKKIMEVIFNSQWKSFVRNV